MKKPQNVTEYISGYPPKTQKALRQIRATIKKAVPRAEEVISYGMPAFKANGIVVYYGAHAKHIGLYPRASGTRAFKQELSKYKGGKGSIQFPLDEPLPLGLIAKIVKFRVAENARRAQAKKR